MKIARVAYLVFATRAIAVATARGSSEDRPIIVREELAAGETVPETAVDIWGQLTGENNCLGCQSEDKDVCDGTLALEGPVIAASLRGLTLGSKTAQVLCTTLLGLCSYPEVEPYTVPVPLKASNATIGPNSVVNGARKPPLKIAHFSDIHIDPLYVTGSNANCFKPMCCRPYTPSDAPGNNDFPAGPFGDHNCGAPVSLEQSMYDAIKAFPPDFALLTGDIVDHAIWNTSVEQNSAEITMAYQHMADTGLLVYGTVGNHEMSPANAIPPSHLGTSAQWLYKVVAEAWERWIGTPTEAKAIAAYSIKHPDTDLRVISVSTNMCDHLQWLVGELDKAEKADERVYLVGHMPMGTSDALHDGSKYFDQVVNRYKSSIAGMFFGHTHLDHFQISCYSDYQNRNASNAVAMSYIAPSMTPLSGMPAFRIYTVNPDTFGILDVDTYVADMADPGFQDEPTWKKTYSAKETFCALLDTPILADAELTPAFWHNVTVALEGDPAAFDAYWARRTRGWNVPECDDACRRAEICQLRAARSQDNCFVPRPGASFGIRAEEGSVKKPADGDRSVARETIGSLAVRKGQIELLERLINEEQGRV